MHKDSVMGRRSFAVSLASDGPIPLDSQPGSVLGEKHLVYRDLQISETLEIVKDRALHVLLDHGPPGENNSPFGSQSSEAMAKSRFSTLALDGSRARVPARC